MKSLKGKPVLLTGATGFIGKRLAARLLELGAQVHAIVRAESQEKLPAKLRPLVGDLTDPRSVAQSVWNTKPELVFHLAKPRGASIEVEFAISLTLAASLRATAPKARLVRTAHAVRWPPRKRASTQTSTSACD